MTAKVIPLAGPREPREGGERLKFRIDPEGALVIQPVRPDGIKVPSYVVPSGAVDRLLSALKTARASFESRRLRERFPEMAQPKPSPAPRDICRRRRDGSRKPIGGCRRNRGHEGQCRDVGGDYVPAICSHIGMGRTKIKIATTGEEWLTCMSCGQRT